MTFRSGYALYSTGYGALSTKIRLLGNVDILLSGYFTTGTFSNNIFANVCGIFSQQQGQNIREVGGKDDILKREIVSDEHAE
uniref:Lipoprotein n=1 Tax=Steinernema glaseri TaxID=37863 RepID=A0A1I7ZJR0_9BILA